MAVVLGRLGRPTLGVTSPMLGAAPRGCRHVVGRIASPFFFVCFAYLFIYLFIYMLYSMWLSPHSGSLVRLCSIVYVMQFGNYQLYSPIIYCRGFCVGYIIYTSTIVGICKSSSSKQYISIVLPFDICRYS